jgi:heme/copper-type cytochrome/quinol oxidase subunit 2
MDQLRKISLIGLAFLLLSITITGISSGQNEIPDEVTWFFGLGAAVCAVAVIFWFVIWILVAIWVYRDAEKRGSSGGSQWMQEFVHIAVNNLNPF